MTEAQAFRWIQKTSMDRRQTMRAVAEEVLAETEKAARRRGQVTTRPAARAATAARQPADDAGMPGPSSGRRLASRDAAMRRSHCWPVRERQAGGAGHTTPVVTGARRLRPPPAGKRSTVIERTNLWCHVGLPRAGTFSTRSSCSGTTLATRGCGAQRHGNSAGRNEGNIPSRRHDPSVLAVSSVPMWPAVPEPSDPSRSGRYRLARNPVAVQAAQPRGANPLTVLIGDDDVERGHCPAAV